jgi:hypothetical protein
MAIMRALLFVKEFGFCIDLLFVQSCGYFLFVVGGHLLTSCMAL